MTNLTEHEHELVEKIFNHIVKQNLYLTEVYDYLDDILINDEYPA